VIRIDRKLARDVQISVKQSPERGKRREKWERRGQF
jgi:hypothetical protein